MVHKGKRGCQNVQNSVHMVYGRPLWQTRKFAKQILTKDSALSTANLKAHCCPPTLRTRISVHSRLFVLQKKFLLHALIRFLILHRQIFKKHSIEIGENVQKYKKTGNPPCLFGPERLFGSLE